MLVPIWLTRAKVAALERHHGIRLLPEGAPADLDYKPDARTNRPFAQPTIYALALIRLAGFASSISNAPGSTRTITAEFFPRTVLAHTN